MLRSDRVTHNTQKSIRKVPAILRMFKIKKKRYLEFATQDNISIETEILVICWFTVSINFRLYIVVMNNKEIKNQLSLATSNEKRLKKPTGK